MTIPDAFFDVAETRADHPALQLYDGRLQRIVTFRELAETARRFARALIDLAIKPEDRVVILSENRPEWGMAYLGIVTAGAVAVPLDMQCTDDEIGRLIDHCEARAVVVSEKTSPLVARYRDRFTCVTLDAPGDSRELSFQRLIDKEQASRHVLDGPSQSVAPDETASLLYTSGTTASPKGVLLTHTNFLSNARAVIEAGLATEKDNVLAILPLHHAYPFMVSFLIPLLLGARITFLQSLKGPELLSCVRETSVTVIVGVPQVFAQFQRAIVKELEQRPPVVRRLVAVMMRSMAAVRQATGRNLAKSVFASVHKRFGPSLRLLVSGGARLDPQVADFLYGMGFTILEGYGLSETAPILTINPLARQKFGSVGQAITGVEVRVADPDAAGVGEVTVKGPNVMAGYFRNPEATKEVIRDEWFSTGDLGYLDEDGYLFLTGRSKELIVLAGGKNVYPEEVEAVYRASPAIEDMCVVGRQRPGEGGESLHAVVFPNFSYFKEQKIGNVRETIRNHLHALSGELSPYKRVCGLTVVREPLPRTRLGKLQRHCIQEMARRTIAQGTREPAALSDADRRLIGTEPGVRVVAALRELLQDMRPIGLDEHLELDLGIDSLRRVELVVTLERHVGPLPPAFGAEVSTVREIIERVIALRSLGAQSPSPAEAAKNGFGSWSEIFDDRCQDQVVLPPHASAISWTHHLQTRIGCGLLHVIGRAGFRISASGLEHLPREGPCLFAANHASYMDAFLVAGVVPFAMFDRLFFLGWEPYFRSGVSAWFARIAHVVPVDAEKHLINAMQTAAALLKRGKSVMIFPEGSRSLDGRLMEFKKGIGVLAAELHVPVVPVWIQGTFHAWPMGQRLPRRYPVHVKFGRPLHISASVFQEWRMLKQDAYALATQRIRDAVLELAGC